MPLQSDSGFCWSTETKVRGLSVTFTDNKAWGSKFSKTPSIRRPLWENNKGGRGWEMVFKQRKNVGHQHGTVITKQAEQDMYPQMRPWPFQMFWGSATIFKGLKKNKIKSPCCDDVSALSREKYQYPVFSNLHPVKCGFSHFTHQHTYINKQKNPSTTIHAKYCKYSLLSMTTKDLKQTKDIQHKVFILSTHMAVFKQGFCSSLSVDNQSRQIKLLCLCSGKSHIRAL